MSLSGKYELGELLKEGDVKTFAARDVSSQEAVLVHQISGTVQVELMRMVVRYLRDAPPGARTHVLDMFADSGDTYLVTDVLPAFSTLQAWLESQVPASVTPAVGAVRRAGGGPVGPSPRAVEPEGEQAGIDLDVQRSGLQLQPGQLTTLIQAPSIDARTRPASPPPSPQAPRAAASSPPSEILETVALNSAPSSASAPASKAGVGESQEPSVFNQLFQSPPTALNAAEAGPPQFPAGPSADQPQPGEFTRVFHPSWGESRVAPGEEPRFGVGSPSESQAPGELTRILQSGSKPDADVPAHLGTSGPAPSGLGAGTPVSTDSSFTSIFGPSASSPVPTLESTEPALVPGTFVPHTLTASAPAEPGPRADSPVFKGPVETEQPIPSPPVRPLAEVLPAPKVKPILPPPQLPPVVKPPEPPSPPKFRPNPPAPPVRPARVPPVPDQAPVPSSGPSLLPPILILSGLALLVLALILWFKYS